MKLTIAMIVLMWSIPPFVVWRWQCACYVSTWFSRIDLSCTLRLFKYEHWIVELVNSGIEGSCNPTQLVVFIIQQESVDSSIYLSILLGDQCWECPLVKVWSLGLVPKYCYRCLFTVLLRYYCCVTTACLLSWAKHFSGAVATAHIYSYHLYFTISSPN